MESLLYQNGGANGDAESGVYLPTEAEIAAKTAELRRNRPLTAAIDHAIGRDDDGADTEEWPDERWTIPDEESSIRNERAGAVEVADEGMTSQKPTSGPPEPDKKSIALEAWVLERMADRIVRDAKRIRRQAAYLHREIAVREITLPERIRSTNVRSMHNIMGDLAHEMRKQLRELNIEVPRDYRRGNVAAV